MYKQYSSSQVLKEQQQFITVPENKGRADNLTPTQQRLTWTK